MKASNVLNLSPDESLVFFELLARINSLEVKDFIVDEAEQIVLWNLECQLESILDEPIQPEYEDLLEKARQRVKENGS